MTFRYGMIGSGMMGQEHIRNIALLKDTRVVAVSDPDEGMRRAAADLAGARGYADYHDMLAAGGIDAVVIASPNHTHHAILRDVLETELPVLCEKPLGVTLKQCRDIAEWQAVRTAPLWVAMEYRYMAPVQRLLSEVRSGRAGKVQMLTIREHRFPFLEKVGDWNRFSANTGGTLVEKCCHHFDLMRLVLNAEPVRVMASAGVDVNHLDETYDGRVPDIVDNAYVIVDFDTGARGMLELCMFAEGAYWQETISAVGNKARIEAKIPGPARFAADGKSRDGMVSIADRASGVEVDHVIETDPTIMAAGDHHGSTFHQHENFVAMVRSGGAPDVSVRDGLIAVAIGRAAHESAETGQAVEIEL